MNPAPGIPFLVVGIPRSLWFADPRHLSALMAGLLRAYVHHYHRRHGFVGHLWQGRFKSPANGRDG